jgi:hypothetical protein
VPHDPDDLVGATVERAAEKVAAASGPPRRGLAVWTVGGTIIVLLLGVLGVLLAVDVSLNRQLRSLQNGQRCILADLDDHRHTNQGAHNRLAESLHVEIVQPDVAPLSPGQAQVLKASCSLFVGGDR